MKHKTIYKIMAAAILMIAVICFGWRIAKQTQTEISKDTGIRLYQAAIVSKDDTHGGFHGDGTTFIVVDCSKIDVIKEMQNAAGWKELPLSDSSRNLIYTFCDLPFPEITNGYYYFCDRHREAAGIYDDTKVTERSSLNFTIAVYDSDTGMLYYSRVDT